MLFYKQVKGEFVRDGWTMSDWWVRIKLIFSFVPDYHKRTDTEAEAGSDDADEKQGVHARTAAVVDNAKVSIASVSGVPSCRDQVRNPS